jgi:lysozyme
MGHLLPNDLDLDALGQDLAEDEGERLTMYRCSEGFQTIGIGHNMDTRPISKRASRLIFEDDVQDCLRDLDRAVPWWRSLSEGRQRALANLTFNMGISRLLGFKNMLAALHRGDYKRAALECLDSKWAKQVQKSRIERITRLIREG